jgi:hypothetical protein
MNVTIYALVDPRNDLVFYVGRTKNIQKRIAKHNSRHTNKGTPKHEYIQKILDSGFRVDYFLLDEVPKTQGKFWEEFYTQLFRSWGYTLYNNLHYKMGNQTSFQPGHYSTPVIAFTTSGQIVAAFDSVKSAKQFVNGKQVSQSLIRENKTTGGFAWLTEKEYRDMTEEDFNKWLKWVNSNDRGKINSGCFKKGLNPWNKVEISDDLAKSIVQYFDASKLSSRKVAEYFNLPRSVVERVIKATRPTL